MPPKHVQWLMENKLRVYYVLGHQGKEIKNGPQKRLQNKKMCILGENDSCLVHPPKTVDNFASLAVGPTDSLSSQLHPSLLFFFFTFYPFFLNNLISSITFLNLLNKQS